MPPVLICCADPILGPLLAQFVAESGYLVTSVVTSEDAWAHLASLTVPTLLLWDLAEKTGPPHAFALLDHLRAQVPPHGIVLLWFREIPIPHADQVGTLPLPWYRLDKPFVIDALTEALTVVAGYVVRTSPAPRSAPDQDSSR